MLRVVCSPGTKRICHAGRDPCGGRRGKTRMGSVPELFSARIIFGNGVLISYGVPASHHVIIPML